MKVLAISALAAMTFTTTSLGASEVPGTGIVHGVKERSSLRYDCSESGGILTCEFTQSSVSKKVKVSDWLGRVAEAKKMFVEMQKDPKQTAAACLDKNMTEFRSALQGGSAAKLPKKAQDNLSKMNQMERLDILNALDAMQTLCTEKTEAAALKLTRIAFDRDLRSCRVSSNVFKQKFKWIDDYGGTGAWVTIDSPQGPCGVVQLSRFEKDKAASKTTYAWWNYYARKAVTNPTGKVFGLECAKLDQEVYPFLWDGRSEAGMRCDYIDFSF